MLLTQITHHAVGPRIGISQLWRILCTALLLCKSIVVCAEPKILPPENALLPTDLGIVINDNDPLSVKIGNYYQERRQIPAKNIFHIRLSTKNSEISSGEFVVQKKLLDSRLPQNIQALALTWAKPYRVGCMSITSAFAFGFNEKYCASGCATTATSEYFDASSRTPFNSYRVRPTMMLAARDLQAASNLIERGIISDNSVPMGTAYLLETSDNARSARKIYFAATQLAYGNRIPIKVLHSDVLQYETDVMFYFTGLVQVPDIQTNHFLPGAVADHLTSFGGQLTDSSQMSALRWLENGATGSYGTVVEPCAFPTKFPNPAILLQHYLAGETLIEAYWKSVAMPGQGVFIGEPLARPYAGYRVEQRNDRWYVSGPALQSGSYVLEAADKINGPFEHVASGLQVSALTRTLELPEPVRAFYKLQRIETGVNLIPQQPPLPFKFGQ